MRSLAERFGGIDRRRPLPVFARQSLGAWFRNRCARRAPGKRGDVVFFGDSFSSYTEPEIGIASIELLERAGWRVRLVDDVCCGRSLISKGLLDAARNDTRKLARAARAASPRRESRSSAASRRACSR